MNIKRTLLILVVVQLIACKSDDINDLCDTTNSEFQQAYTAVLATNTSYTDATTMDLQTHEYTFEVSVDKRICSIGYRGDEDLFNGNSAYTIEIEDNSTNTLVYVSTHLFNHTQTDYFSIPPVTLMAGTSYTLRRTVNDYLGNIGNTIGRLLRFNGTSPFPITQGDITFTASNFYGTGGPVPNFALPFIDLVFES